MDQIRQTARPCLALVLSRHSIRDLLDRAVREEAGQSLTEYSMILLGVAIVAVVVLGFLSQNILGLLQPVINAFHS